MKSAQTQIHRQHGTIQPVSGFCTGVSLHSHTHHSKESAEFIPLFVQRVPVLNKVVSSAVRRYEDRTGIALDFHRIYWTPPVSPAFVLQSETQQIEEKLGIASLVSITDHDTIAGALELRRGDGAAAIPISLEWTVPFAGTSFHLGVHHLPPVHSAEIMRELSSYTSEPNHELLGDLLALLGRSPETLLVLNHPGCDFFGLGRAKHEACLRDFLSQWRCHIHALEFNALRPPSENNQALRIAEEFGLPVVSGGDRHGCRPNGAVNLTQARCWGDYVAQIRNDRLSNLLILPVCEEPVRLRELQTVADVVRHYPNYRYGHRQFTDRVFVDLEGYSWHPLSFYWSGGMPLWLRPLFYGLGLLGSNQARPVLRCFLSLLKDKAFTTYPSEVISAE